MTIITRFTKQFGLDHPIMLAPMGGVAGGELTAAVSNAGGLGMLGAGYGDLAWLERELEIVKKKAKRPWGVGFITWSLSQEAFDLAMSYAPDAVMFSFGDIRPWLEQARQKKLPVLSQVHDLHGAMEAHKAGVDFIVAQGTEAGGHGTGQRTTLSLLRGIKKQSMATSVIAAGGIADGPTMAAAIQLGADAVSMGTRFYASFEALAHYRMKERLVECSGDDTVRTEVFDIVREINWPKGIRGRAITNKFVARWHGNEAELKRFIGKNKALYFDAQAAADPKIAVVWAGEGLDYIFDIKEAAKIIRSISRSAEKQLGAGLRLSQEETL